MATSANAQGSYTIKSGDTLSEIALEHSCTIVEIRKANRIRGQGHKIKVGDVLKIPKCGKGPYKIYTVKPGDMLGGIAAKHNCSTKELERANHLNDDTIYAEQKLIIPKKCKGASSGGGGSGGGSHRYVVKSGDILGKIAARHGCSAKALQRANGLKSPNDIKVGQRLVIPNCASSGGGGGRRCKLDTKTLKKLLKSKGFKAPRGFRALVVEVRFNKSRGKVVRERCFDYNGKSRKVGGWNPASTVKLYAAVAALRQVRRLGFQGNPKITFHSRKGAQSRHLYDLLKKAIVPSDNIAYNFLVQLAGFDYLNGEFFPFYGLTDTALTGAYHRSKWMKMGFSPSFRRSPRITIEGRGKKKVIEARSAKHNVGCGSSACTSLFDLYQGMRALMLTEQLPKAESFRLNKRDRQLIRQWLRAHRNRGEEVVDALGRSFDDPGTLFYHKAGYSNGWYSDNVYVYDPGGSAWIIILASSAGRKSLNTPARLIGELAKAGKL